MAADVLEDHDRVVDDAADRDHHAAEGEDVQGDALPVEDDQGDQQRQRDGDRGDDGGARAAQEGEDHQHGEDGAEQALLENVADRLSDRRRLVGD